MVHRLDSPRAPRRPVVCPRARDDPGRQTAQQLPLDALSTRHNGWTRVRVDADGRTREPSPLAAFADGRLFPLREPDARQGTGTQRRPRTSGRVAIQRHRTDGGPGIAGTGMARQAGVHGTFLQDVRRRRCTRGTSPLSEHRLHARRMDISRQCRQVERPGPAQVALGHRDAKPGPIRVCYPNVAIRDRAVHFVGVSDVLEPNPAWREFKRELTGQEWDYDFRRLFYTWTPDITKQPFAEWVEIASRDATGGHVQPGDLWLSPNGDAHLIWSERAIDERLREKFFPDAKQSEQLNYAVVRGGKLSTIVARSWNREGVLASSLPPVVST